MTVFICHHGVDLDQVTCVQCDIEHMKRKPLGNANSPAASMTLREHFAGLAMQGWLANKERPQHFLPKDDMSYCVKIADALLAELAKPVQP